MPLSRYVLLGGLLVLALAPARAAAPPAGGVRLDREGEPLPEGAFARLGTARFRVGPHALIELAPDGKTIAVVEVSALRFLDAHSGRELRRIEMPSPRSGAFCPLTGAFALVSRDRQTLRFYRPGTSRPLREIDLDGLAADHLAFSGDGKVLAVGGDDGAAAVCLFDATGRRLRKLRPRHSGPIGVALSANGRALVSWMADVSAPIAGAEAQQAQAWDVRTGKELLRLDAGATVSCAALSPDGKLLALVTVGGRLRLWSLEAGKRLAAFQARFAPPHRLSFSRDGSVLLVGDSAGVLAWDVKSGKRLRVPAGPPAEACSFVWAANGEALACSRAGSALAVWKVFAGKARFPEKGHRSGVQALAFSPDGRRVVSVDGAQRAMEWDLTGRPRRSLRAGLHGPLGEELFDEGGPAVLSRGSEYLVLETGRGRGLYDLATGEMVLSLPSGVEDPVFSADGAFLASHDGLEEKKGDRARIFRAATGEEVASFAREGPITALALSPGGKRLVVATGNEKDRKRGATLSLWDVGGRRPVAAFRPALLPGVVQRAGGMVCSPRGDVLAVGTVDNDVHLLSLRTGARLRSASLGEEFAFRLAFSPDGRSLAILTLDADWARGRLALWEARSGLMRWELPPSGPRVTALAFSPEGKVLATGHADGSILLWDVTGQRLAQPARARARVLREGERLWADLGSADARAAFAAGRALAAAPAEAVALLRRRLRPDTHKPAGPAAVARWVRELDSDDFATRERARAALAREGGHAEAVLRQALAAKPPLEQRRQIEGLLARLAPERVPSEMVRPLRAVEVLEWAGTAEARRFLA
jgi:WD40 repeat protein